MHLQDINSGKSRQQAMAQQHGFANSRRASFSRRRHPDVGVHAANISCN